MKLKLKLVQPSGGSTDIVVTTDSSATVAEVAATILQRDPTLNGSSASQLLHPTLAVTFPGESRTISLRGETPVSEAQIASGAHIAIVSSEADPNGGAGPVLARGRIVAGPDTGREFALHRGITVIGRDASSDVVLTDSLVSKRHARIEVTRTVDLVDLNSANGLLVDGGLVTRVSLPTGGTIQLGDSVIRFDIVAPLEHDDGMGRTGPVQFNRSPRVEPRYPGEEFEGPEIPKEEDPVQFPWIALAAPVVMGIAFIFLPGTSAFRFLFIALAPIIMIGTFASQAMTRKRKRVLAIKKFDEQLAYLSEALGREATKERAVRLAEAPSTEEVVTEARRFGPLLWTRRPEHWSFLNVRLGVGSAPTRNTVSGINSKNGLPEYIERFEALVESHRLVDDVPLIDNLQEAGALGIAGSPIDSAGALHGILVQLAGLYSPAEVSFAGVVSPTWATQFEWLKWLPHTASPHTPLPMVQLADSLVTSNAVLAQIEELIESRTAGLSGPSSNNHGPISLEDSAMARGQKVGNPEESKEDERPPLPCVVLLISDDAPVDRARLVSIIERATLAGVFPIWLSESVAKLPAACRTYLEVHETQSIGDTASVSATVGYVRVGESFHAVSSSLTSVQAMEFAKGLAGVTDAGALIADESDMPRSVSLLSLLGAEMSESSDAVIDRWQQNDSLHDRTPGAPHKARRAGKLRAIVGQSSLDSMHLDLRTQGPHALVGGTTGSGKSEFLQAWVLGMAAEYSPDRVSFLFVDYKGGSAFADCVSLPHTVGLVTDLSPHLVRRALTSLRAELHHREHLFNRKKVKDLIELEKRGDPESPPALILVIDEFAALVGEVPEFVDGVVDIAQRGRSLGIHLIMATQRPAGVIRDNLRANTNLRIALRMADAHDSVDVVGLPIAATFDPSIPGRGVVKSGPGRVDSFQTGYAGGWTNAVVAAPAIEVADLAFGYERQWDDPNPPQEEELDNLGPNDTARLVATIVKAATDAEVPNPRRPWLDELALSYDLALLKQRTDEELVLGVADDPTKQQQYPVYFQPDYDGNLAIYGTGGSGKSVALRTLAVAAGITPRGGPVQVYGIDFSSGGLRMLENLPHVGSIVSGDDSERVVRLIRMLRGMIDERVERYAAARAGTVTEYRTLAKRPQEPRILLFVDGMATFRQEYEFSGTSNVFPMFAQILSDGRQVGIHVVVTADRPASVSPVIAASIQRRIALRLADDNDYLLLDSPADVVTSGSAPGRAIVGGLETQIAVLGGSSSVADQSLAIDKLASAMRAQNIAEAPSIERLSDNIRLSEIIEGRPGEAIVGVADDNLEAVAIVPEGAFLLAGPPSSGRSTALHTLVRSVHIADPGMTLVYLGNAKSPLKAASEFSRVAAGIEDVQALAKELLPELSIQANDKKRYGIVIESISDFLSTPADPDLIALLKASKRNDHFILAEGETSTLMPSWPLLMEVKSARRGFALQPDQQEGDTLFRTSYPRAKRADFPPGRGWMIQGGKTRRVQLALPE